MITQKHTPEELAHALKLIRSECQAHPQDCQECPLSFQDEEGIAQCGIIDRYFLPAEWEVSPAERWQAFADETRRADP